MHPARPVAPAARTPLCIAALQCSDDAALKKSKNHDFEKTKIRNCSGLLLFDRDCAMHFSLCLCFFVVCNLFFAKCCTNFSKMHKNEGRKTMFFSSCAFDFHFFHSILSNHPWNDLAVQEPCTADPDTASFCLWVWLSPALW